MPYRDETDEAKRKRQQRDVTALAVGYAVGESSNKDDNGATAEAFAIVAVGACAVGAVAAGGMLGAGVAKARHDARDNFRQGQGSKAAKVGWSITEAALASASVVGTVAAGTLVGTATGDMSPFLHETIKYGAEVVAVSPALGVMAAEVKDAFASAGYQGRHMIERCITGPAARLAKKAAVGMLAAGVLSSAVSVAQFYQTPAQDRLGTVVEAVMDGPVKHTIRGDARLLNANTQYEHYGPAEVKAAMRHIEARIMGPAADTHPALAVAAATLALNADQARVDNDQAPALTAKAKENLVADIARNLGRMADKPLRAADQEAVDMQRLNPVATMIENTTAGTPLRATVIQAAVSGADKIFNAAAAMKSASDMAKANRMLITAANSVPKGDPLATDIAGKLIAQASTLQKVAPDNLNWVAAGSSLRTAWTITADETSLNKAAFSQYTAWLKLPPTAQVLGQFGDSDPVTLDRCMTESYCNDGGYSNPMSAKFEKMYNATQDNTAASPAASTKRPLPMTKIGPLLR